MALGTACALAYAYPASAQAPAQSQSEDGVDKKADELFTQGVKLYEKKKFKEAWVALEASWRIRAHWKTVLYLGHCEARLGMHKEAAQHLHTSRRFVEEAGDPTLQKKWETDYAEALQHVVRVMIVVDQDRVPVTVNGESLGRSPFSDPLFRDPGKFEVVAGEKGNEVRELLELDAGESAEVKLSLASGQKTSGHKIHPKPGKGETVDPWSTPTAPSTAKRVVLYSGGALAVIGFATGIGSALQAHAEKDKLNDAREKTGRTLCTTQPNSGACSDLSDAEDNLKFYSTLSTIGYVTGGVALVGTAAVYFLWEDAPVSTAVTPLLGPSVAGLSVQSTF